MADRTVSVKLRAEVSEYMANMRAAGKATSDLERASKQLQVAFDNEEDAAGKVRVAQAKLNDVQKKGKATSAQLATAQERLASAQRQHARAVDETRAASERYSQVQKRVGEEVQNTEESIVKSGRATESVAKRANVQWRLLVGALSVGGPAIAAAGLAAAVGGVSAAFVGLGAVALKNNSQVRSSFIELGQEIKTGAAQDASVMQDELAGAADMIGARYEALRPQIRSAFDGASDLIEPLTNGVLDFAENAMPGMVNAISSADPVIAGLSDLLAKTGTGLSDFLDAAAENSDAAGQGLSHLGDLIEGVLGETGGLLGHLTQLWAEHGDEVADVITKIISILSDLTGSALPVLSSTAGTALHVIAGILAAIEPMTGILGPVIASWLALSGAIKAMSGVGSIVSSLTRRVSEFGTGASKGAAAAGVALVGISTAAQLALGSVGEFSASTSDTVEGLESFSRTGRASGEAARVFGSDLSGLGDAMSLVTQGGFVGWTKSVSEGLANLVGAQGELGDAEDQLKTFDEALASLVTSGNQRQAFKYLQDGARQAGVSVGELKAQLPGYTEALDNARRSQADLGTTALQSRPGISELEEALDTLSVTTSATSDKVDALNTAWRELFGVALTMEEATAAFEGGLDDIRASLEEVRGSSANWRGELLTANGSINLTTEAGRKLSEQLIAQGEDYRSLAQSAYDTALRQGKSQQEATAVAVRTSQRRRGQFIAEMRQMGFTAEQARKLANRYFGIPGDVRTLITQPGMASAIANARRLRDTLNGIPPYVQTAVSIAVPGAGVLFNALNAYSTLMGGYRDGGEIGAYAGGGEIQRFASGGGAYQDQPVGMLRGPGGPKSDSILAAVSSGEFVSTYSSTQRNRGALEAGNRGAKLVAVDQVEALAGGGLTGKALAAQKALEALRADRTFYEDFSFRGAGSLNGRWNDILAEEFQRGNYSFNRRDVESYLSGVVRRGRHARPVEPHRINRRAEPSPSAGRMAGAGAQGVTVVFNFPNYVGNRAELMTAIRKDVSTNFAGDVQKALGRTKAGAR